MPAKKPLENLKRNHTIRFTDHDWEAAQKLAKQWGFRGLAPLIVAIVQGDILLSPAPHKKKKPRA